MKRIEHKPRDSKEVVRLHALHKCVRTVPLRIDSDGWPPKGAVGRWRTNGGDGSQWGPRGETGGIDYRVAQPHSGASVRASLVAGMSERPQLRRLMFRRFTRSGEESELLK